MPASLPIDWSEVFDQIFERQSPASDDAIATVFAPLTQAEIESIISDQRNPWRVDDLRHASWKPIDPRTWALPSHSLPPQYVDFLKWSDGAAWQTGEREFSCFGCADLRSYMLNYHFPEYQPGAVPIGLDGGGIFGVFDLRTPSNHQVLAVGSGVPDWSDVLPIAETFEAFCRDTTRVADAYWSVWERLKNG